MTYNFQINILTKSYLTVYKILYENPPPRLLSLKKKKNRLSWESMNNVSWAHFRPLQARRQKGSEVVKILPLGYK